MDYWDFEPIRETFFTAFPNTRVTCSRGGLYRLRGGMLTLIAPPQSWSLAHLPDEFTFKRFKAVSRIDVPETVPRFKKLNNWFALPGYQPTRTARQALRRGHREGVVIRRPSVARLQDLLEGWKAWARVRHYGRIGYSHYAQMIVSPHFRFYGVFLGGQLIAAIGFVTQDGEACVGFAKNRPGHWWLAKFLWARGVQLILGTGVSRVNCGDTADKIKRAVGLESQGVYRPRDPFPVRVCDYCGEKHHQELTCCRVEDLDRRRKANA